MKKAKIILGVQYDKDEQLEELIQSITMDTEGYTHIASGKPSLSVWVDDVLDGKRKMKK